MRGWYKDAANRPPPPSERISLETLTMERAEIYAHVPPPGRPIIIELSHLPVDDNILGEENIAEAVIKLQLHCDDAPSVMKEEHLRIWHRTENLEGDPDPGNWEKVVAIVQVVFRGERTCRFICL